jgi:quercetin dioxygenase-like cupin family protein
VTEPVKILNLWRVADDLPSGGVPVHGAPARGVALHSNGQLGADMLYVKAGDRFPVHTHPGDHLLMCLAGEGTITVAEVTYRILPGDLYMVDGSIPHAVGAVTDHVLMAIGSPHKPIDSPERMSLVDWSGRPVTNPLHAG